MKCTAIQLKVDLPNLRTAGVCECGLVWSLATSSSTGLGRSRLWHSHTNGPFSGQINQTAPGLGHCPESTVWRAAHLTSVL